MKPPIPTPYHEAAIKIIKGEEVEIQTEIKRILLESKTRQQRGAKNETRASERHAAPLSQDQNIHGSSRWSTEEREAYHQAKAQRQKDRPEDDKMPKSWIAPYIRGAGIHKKPETRLDGHFRLVNVYVRSCQFAAPGESPFIPSKQCHKSLGGQYDMDMDKKCRLVEYIYLPGREFRMMN